MNSTDITPFYKMTGVLARMDDSLKKHQPQPWTDNKTLLQSLSPRAQAQKINHIINSYPYVSDITNWGVTDYWETPDEFFEDGGDCEDFALAKYAWLHSLGVPERRLRIAIVHDTIKDATHAVLILYINRVALVLDDQVDEIREGRAVTRYRMLYSINRLGWWLPALSGLPAPSVVPAE
jgi:predicted transglutaminase-like cysteine proteinase